MADETRPESMPLPEGYPNLGTASDEAVVALCLAGGPQAAEPFSELVNRYREPIYGLALHITGDAEEARDLAQQSFVKAYLALQRFRPGAKFSSWLYTIAMNLCRSHLRKQKHRPISIDSFPEPDLLPSDEAVIESPADVHGRADLRRMVLSAVNSLPTKYRVVVVLRHLNDMSYKEIAETLKLPVTTVEHRLRTARDMLRQRLGEDLALEV